MTLEELTTKLEALQKRADEAVATVEGDSSKYEEVKALIDSEIKPEIERIQTERKELEREEEIKALRTSHEDLSKVLEELKKPSGDFQIGSIREVEVKSTASHSYGDGERSYFYDLHLAAKNDVDAKKRINEGIDEGLLTPEGKALVEGTGAQGGYLVTPSIERRIVEAIELDNVLRGLCSKINVTTNAIQLDQIGLTTTAGWVAELATKPESTGLSLATVTANVFTAAGLATISNQLLADSNPAVDGLVVADLVKRLTALEEIAFLNGSGSGQPLGILQTPGLGANTYTEASPTVAALLDEILDSIATVQTNHGQPNAILMHPRTWTRILKSKDAAGHYLIGPPTATGYPNPTDPRTIATGPTQSLFGVKVVLSNRMPTNLGGGTNESRIIVGDFTEALILDRQGVTVDESPHVYFTSNQTVFRAEKRLGFTAARTPAAFDVIGGTGLAAG